MSGVGSYDINAVTAVRVSAIWTDIVVFFDDEGEPIGTATVDKTTQHDYANWAKAYLDLQASNAQWDACHSNASVAS
jgi:hypothetical protein